MSAGRSLKSATTKMGTQKSTKAEQSLNNYMTKYYSKIMNDHSERSSVNPNYLQNHMLPQSKLGGYQSLATNSLVINDETVQN